MMKFKASKRNQDGTKVIHATKTVYGIIPQCGDDFKYIPREPYIYEGLNHIWRPDE